MTSEQMLYEFELSADKVSGKNAMNLPLPAKVAYLNRGQITLILNRYDGTNVSRTGFEETRKRTEDLQLLVIPSEKLSVSKENEDLYYADLKSAQQKYLILLRHWAVGSKGECKGQRIKTTETQYDDLEEALRNAHRKPDFRWREALLTTADNKLWIHTDKFKIDSVFISYLRYPRKIDVAGYTDFENKASTDVACELPEYLHDDVVSEAVANLKADLGDPAFQTAVYKAAKKE